MIQFDPHLIGLPGNSYKTNPLQTPQSKQYPIQKSEDTVEIGMGNPPTLESITRLLEDRINSQIQTRFPGDEGIALTPEVLAQDWSPEAVSSRIVDFATSFFGIYQTQHPELEGSEIVGNFVSLIRDSIMEGFNQAKEILNALSVFNGEIADTANQTIELAMEKLDVFKSQLL